MPRPASRGPRPVPGGAPRGRRPAGGGGFSAGRCPTPRGRRAGGGDRVRRFGGGDSGRAPGPSRGSPQLRRPSGTPFARGPPAGRLGWRLAADLELVRTRGIRLFN